MATKQQERGEKMRGNGFAKGMIIGSMIGASVGMAMNSDVMSSRSKRRMRRKGMDLMRKSGAVLSDVISLLR
jgi:gas vesicle protein